MTLPTAMETSRFDTMSEMDVRELIVRPFLHRLGYAHGTTANIRTDVSLRYSKAQLGRKNPRDPNLPGARKPDYVCEVVAHGRFVVEAKAGYEALTAEDAAQAYSYAAHPEVAAFYFLLTNGREFRIYNYGDPTQPLLTWAFEEIEQRFAAIANILGPSAIKRRALAFKPDTGKPLAPGIASETKIVGGLLTYREVIANNPAFQGEDFISGANAPVLGRRVYRSTDQLITAELEIAGPFANWAALNKAIGLESFRFSTADEFISTDPDKPSIFQNVVEATMPPGLKMKLLPNTEQIVCPVPIVAKVFTQAVGYLDETRFIGVFDNEYEMLVVWPNLAMANAVAAIMPGIDRVITMTGGGEFEIRIS